MEDDDLEEAVAKPAAPTPEELAASQAEERAKVEQYAAAQAQLAKEQQQKELEEAHRALDTAIADSPLWEPEMRPKRLKELVICNEAEMETIADLRVGITLNNRQYLGKYKHHMGKFVPIPPPKGKK